VDLPACWHSRGPDDDDNIADSRGARGWRVGVLGVSGDGGVGTYLASSPCFPFLPLPISLSSSPSSLVTLARV